MKPGFSLILGCLLSFLPLLANAGQDEEAITKVVQLFVDCGDQQDTELADQALHSESKQFIPGDHFKNGLFVITKEKYLSLLRIKKIGGVKRGVKIHSIDIDTQNKNAVAKIELTSDRMLFYQFIGLSKIKDEGWKIVSVLTSTVVPQKN